MSLKIHPSTIVKILGSGVDVQTYTPLPLPDFPPVVVFVSRLLYSKGIDEYVKAAPIVLEHFPDSKFMIVGSPDYSNPSAISQSYLNYICSLPYINYLGHRKDIFDVISSAHILVLPSFYPEGLPKVLCEAAACARPVITSNLPGCIDAIEEGVTGISIQPRNHIELASSLITMLSDPDNLKLMSISSRKRAQQLFDISTIVDQHMQIYSSYLVP